MVLLAAGSNAVVVAVLFVRLLAFLFGPLFGRLRKWECVCVCCEHSVFGFGPFACSVCTVLVCVWICIHSRLEITENKLLTESSKVLGLVVVISFHIIIFFFGGLKTLFVVPLRFCGPFYQTACGGVCRDIVRSVVFVGVASNSTVCVDVVR